MDERLPQYLHRPVQILWFASDEFIVGLSTIFVAVIVGGAIGWALVGALLLFIPWKRTKPRGFLPHLAWRWGLGQALGLEAPDVAMIAKVAAPPAQHGWISVLFVSSSMPVATLRTYAGQLERVGGVFAFRGMPGGLRRVAPMAKLSAEILRVDPGCNGPSCTMRDVQLIVDPILFRTNGIARVPALTMVPGDPTQPYCERDDQEGASIAAGAIARPVVYGDAALSGMLEEQARLGNKAEVRDAQARLPPR